MIETENLLAQENQSGEREQISFRVAARDAFQDPLQRAVHEFQQALKTEFSPEHIVELRQRIASIQSLIQENIKKPEPEPMTDRNYRKLMMMVVLTGLFCLTPIVMKCADIVMQRPQQAIVFDLNTLTAWLPDMELPDAVAKLWSTTPETLKPSETEEPVQVAQQTPAEPTQNTPITKVVVSDHVNVRVEPSVKTRALVRLKQKEQVNILEESSKEADGYRWIKIRTPDGQVGWVADQFLSDS